MTAPWEQRGRPGRRPPQQRKAVLSACLFNQKEGRDGENDGRLIMSDEEGEVGGSVGAES